MRAALVASVICVLSAGPATATSVSYADFSSVAGLTLNGDAAQSGNVLRVVPNVDSQEGTAFLTTAVPFDATTGFSTAFEFNIATDVNDVTDGFTFLLQNDPAGAAALGGVGQGLGYTGLTPSVAVVFRGRNPNLIGVITGGLDPADASIDFKPAGYYTGTEGEFYNKNEFAWIDYNPMSTVLSVFLSTTSTKPATAIMSTTVDIFGTLGSQAFVGFSAGNGGAFGDQDILNWSFDSSEVRSTAPGDAAVPEPATVALLGIGLAGLVAVRRTRR